MLYDWHHSIESFVTGYSYLVCVLYAKLLQSCMTVCNPLACEASLSMGFSSQEYWSGFPCPPSGDLPDSGIKPRSPASAALAGRFFTTFNIMQF